MEPWGGVYGSHKIHSWVFAASNVLICTRHGDFMGPGLMLQASSARVNKYAISSLSQALFF